MKKQTGFASIVALIVIAIVAAGSVGAYKNGYVQKIKNLRQQTSNAPAQDISSWKTYAYRGDNAEVTLRYPSNWYQEDKNISNYKAPYPEPLPKNFVKIQIQIHTKPASQTLEEYASRPIMELGNVVPKYTAVNINGTKGFKTNEIGNGTYYFQLSDTEVFVLIDFSRPDDKSNSPIVSGIISSLKVKSQAL